MSKYHFYKSDDIEFVSVNDTEICFEEHCHTSDFIITLIVKGNATLKKESIHILHTNDFFIILPYEAHTLISDNRISLISMCIKKQMIYKLDCNTYQMYIEASLTEISKQVNINSKQYRLFYAYALEIYKNYHHGQQAEQDGFAVSRNMMEQFPECNNTIEQFANEIYVSKYHYIYKFKEIAGLTPHKFQIQSRIRKSQKLLISQNSIADVSIIVGFYDQSHFDKYFKKIVGISPTEYICSVSNFFTRQKLTFLIYS